ncbi:GNAT family N-acetyltransferase [Nonomuraea phyllanthi]|nr:GNAT family N-acetyltransferase [Nonomuraea phyllanthi]
MEFFLPRQARGTNLAVWCALFSEGQSEVSGDPPRAAALAEQLRAEEDHAVVRRWAARDNDDGRIVGTAQLRPQPHDQRIGFLRLFVAPSARRRGVGTTMLAQITKYAHSAGMDRIQSTVPARSPGESFVRTWPGVRELLRLELQEQRLDEHVLSHCHELAICPDPTEYSLAHWHGAAPEPLAPSFGQVMSHVPDAPGAALQMASRAWDAAAVRTWEARMTASGAHLMVCAAVHRTTGQVVAATVATVAASDAPAAQQHDTVVLPRHRRRGLARWIKAEQTLRLHQRFPSLRTVSSTVNRQNAPMTAVNRAVGYRGSGERLLVELPMPAET